MDGKKEGVISEIIFPIGEDVHAVSKAVNQLIREGWEFVEVNAKSLMVRRMWETEPVLGSGVGIEESPPIDKTPKGHVEKTTIIPDPQKPAGRQRKAKAVKMALVWDVVENVQFAMKFLKKKAAKGGLNENQTRAMDKYKGRHASKLEDVERQQVISIYDDSFKHK